MDAQHGGRHVDNLVLDNVRSVTQYSYAMLLYCKSVRVRNCRMDRATNGTSPLTMYSATGVRSTVWEITGNVIDGLGAADQAVAIGVDATNTFETRVNSILYRSNHSEGGNMHLTFDITNSAGGAGTNYCKVLVLENNTARDVAAATAVQLSFSPVQPTRLVLIGNALIDASGASKNIVVTNPTHVTGGLALSNDVNAIMGLPTTMVTAFFGSVAIPQ